MGRILSQSIGKHSMGSDQIKSVTVVGAGTMGNGIAHVFAQHGYAITLHDVKQDLVDRGLATIRTNLDRQVKKGTISEEMKADTLGRIRSSLSLKLKLVLMWT